MARMIALVFGTVYLVVGVVGFIPGIVNEQGLLLGLFPVNALHNVVHLAVGAALVAGGLLGFARTVMQVLGVVFVLLTLLGVLQAGPGGLLHDVVPLHGADVILHALTALVLLYGGFVAAEERQLARA